MNTILLTALLATTALATPHPLHPIPATNTTTIHNRQATIGSGTDSGLSVSTYTDANCKGTGLSGQELFYGTNYAEQMLSYSLSDDVGDDDELSVWADIDYDPTGSKPVDLSLNGDTEAACAQFVYNLEGDMRTKGCHTLPKVVGCMIVMVSQN